MHAVPNERERVVGLETEYTLLPLNKDCFTGRDLEEAVAEQGLINGHHYKNGARIYIETANAQPEYATPECLYPEGLLEAHFAGQDIMRDAFVFLQERFKERNGIPEPFKSIDVMKRTLNADGLPVGDHENFTVGTGETLYRIGLSLQSHLATRPVLTGPGLIRDNPITQTTEYVLDQRAWVIDDDVSTLSTRDRPMVLSRNEPFGGEDKKADQHRRLQVISGSMNMYAYPILARVFNTSLVLRMIEHDKYPMELVLANPIKAIKVAGSSRGLHARLHLENQKKTITAPAFQYELMSAAAEYGRQHGAPDFEIELAELSAEIAGDLPVRSLHAKWAGHVEHIGKWTHIRAYMDRSGVDIDNPKMKGFDLLWNNVSYGGLVAALRKQGKIAMMPTEEGIAAARHTPPDPTRARLRGKLIDWLNSNGRSSGRYSHNWHEISAYSKSGQGYLHTMIDPWNDLDYPRWYTGPRD